MHVTPDRDADVRVHVVVEALKPEERALLRGVSVIVLNKADLWSAPDGSIAEATRRAARIQSDTGVRAVAMSALLAVAGAAPLDDATVEALQTLTRAPADLSSVDAFVATEHPLSADTRGRLLDRLDRFGVAHAVTALARGTDATELPELMSELSNVAALLATLRSAAAAVRYRRVRQAILELHCLAAGYDALADWLVGDEPVLAAMTAAVDVLEADGLRVDPGDRPEAHRGRAVHWRRYGRGCVGALHRECSADVVRGSLRLLEQSW